MINIIDNKNYFIAFNMQFLAILQLVNCVTFWKVLKL